MNKKAIVTIGLALMSSQLMICSPLHAQEIVPLPQYKTGKQDSLFYGAVNDKFMDQDSTSLDKLIKAHHLNPNNPQINYLLATSYGQLMIEPGNAQKSAYYLSLSKDHIKKALEVEPNNKEFNDFYYRLLTLGESDENELHKVVRRLYNLEPDNIQYALYAALSYLQESTKESASKALNICQSIINKGNNPEQAQQVLSSFISSDPNYKFKKQCLELAEYIRNKYPNNKVLFRYYLYAFLHYQDTKTAQRELNKEYKGRTKDYDYYYSSGLIYLTDKDFKKLNKTLTNLIEAKDVAINEKYNLIESILFADQIPAELRDDITNKLFKAYPTDTDVLKYYVSYLLDKGDSRKAYNLLDKVVTDAPEEQKRDYYSLMIDAAESINSSEDVKKICRKALEEFPRYGFFYFKYALIQAQENQFKDALTTILEGIKRYDPSQDIEDENNLALLYSLAGDLYSDLNNPTEAEKYYQLAYENGSDDAGFLNNYAYFLAQHDRNLDQALEMIQEAVNQDNTSDANMLDTEGYILLKLKKYTQAADVLKTAIKSSQEPNTTLLSHLAQALEATQDSIGAIKAWADVLKKLSDVVDKKSIDLKLKALNKLSPQILQKLISEHPNNSELYTIYANTILMNQDGLSTDTIESKMDECIELLEKAYQINREDTQNTLLLMGVYLRTKRFGDAKQLLEKEEKRHPELNTIWQALNININLQENKIDQAVELFLSYVKSKKSLSSSDIDMLNNLTNYILQSKDYDKLEQFSDALIKIVPGDLSIKQGYFTALINLNRLDKAQELLNLWAKDHKEKTTVFYSNQIALAIAKGDQKKATALFKKFVKQKGVTSQDILGFISYISNNLQEHENNKELYVDLTKIYHEAFPNDFLAYSVYANSVLLNNYDQGIDLLKEGCKLFDLPNTRYLYMDLMSAYMQNNKIEDFNALYDELIKEKIYIPQAFLIKASTLFQNGELSQAEKVLQKGISSCSNDKNSSPSNISQMYGFLGDLYQSEKQNDKALQMYEKAFETDRTNIALFNNYAYYLALADKDLEFALQLIMTANSQTQYSDPNMLDTEAYILYKLGRYNTAKEIQQKAIDLSQLPTATLFDHMGDIEKALNNTEAALDNWQKALTKADESQKEGIKDKIDHTKNTK